MRATVLRGLASMPWAAFPKHRESDAECLGIFERKSIAWIVLSRSCWEPWSTVLTGVRPNSAWLSARRKRKPPMALIISGYTEFADVTQGWLVGDRQAYALIRDLLGDVPRPRTALPSILTHF